jgi:hypothetical protein
VCVLSGCVNQTAEAGQTTWKFAWWLPTVVLLGGLIAAPVGWLWRSKNNYGWVLLIGGPLAAAVFAPGLMADRVTVDDEHFTLRTGFWFAPTRHDIRFADVSRIDITSETRSGRRGRRTTSYYLVCHKTTGDSEKVPVGNLMEYAVGDILATADERGIPVQDMTGG